MSRKLASIQTVKSIKPIDGADRIEIVQILNWDCVARKGEFHEEDRVVYFEIDSLLPDIPAFEFLKGSSWSQKLNKYKISTHKFRNQISQGLVVNINILSDLYKQINGTDTWSQDILDLDVGTDLTEMLKIEKYEPPVSNGPLGETIHHEWYVPKTDEERIQTCAEDILPKYIGSEQNDWYVSLKLDGTSCTAGMFEDGYLVGGRNQFYKDENMYTTTVNKYGNLQDKLLKHIDTTGEFIVFQGELCGPGIQSNKLGLKEKDWFVFNVFTSHTGANGTYIKRDLDYMLKICKKFKLQHVPIIENERKYLFTKDLPIDNMVQELLQYADKFKYRNYFEEASPEQVAEGVVFRMNDMTYSFKVISNKFLLKGGE